MQLAAYCLLVEETSGTPPPYGLLRYAERTFRLDYTPHVREELLALIDQMRVDLEEAECARSHDDARRCQGCGFFERCGEALDDENEDDD
jgi:CRISPR-associated exonuclease Cas4